MNARSSTSVAVQVFQHVTTTREERKTTDDDDNVMKLAEHESSL